MAQDEINDTLAMTRDNAILLLAAAEELGLDPGVVATSSIGKFSVPQSLVDKAGLGEKKPAQKKAPASKRASKKAAATKQKSE